MFNGRAADAREYLDAALRVDPGWKAYRHFTAGLIAFCLDRFEEAVASLEKATPEDLAADRNRRQRLFLLDGRSRPPRQRERGGFRQGRARGAHQET